MLPGPDNLASAILALPTTTDKSAGAMNLVNAIADYMNQMQGGPTGSPGIFALDKSAMASGLAALPAVADNSWISGFANAWEAGVNTAVITPGTVTNPTWTTSSVDVSTLPTGAATITTISAAKATLTSGLGAVSASNNPPHPLAQAIHDATLEFIFTCIGLGPLGVPIPIPTSAE